MNNETAIDATLGEEELVIIEATLGPEPIECSLGATPGVIHCPLETEEV